MLRLPVIALLACACTYTTACSTSRSTSDVPRVGVAFYPIADIVRRLGLPVEPVVLVPAGQEAHDYDPTPKDIERLDGAALFLYLGQGFQPNVESALASMSDSTMKLDLLEQVTLLPVTDPLAGTEGDVGGETLDGNRDPHVWLSPKNMTTMAMAVVDGIVQAGLATAEQGAAALQLADDDYSALDAELHDGLRTCERRELVTTHRAFGYLADAYDLVQISIAGISPAEEPSARTLEAVAAFVREHDVTTIFSEENLPADLAATVAAETGAVTDALDTAESPSAEQLQQSDDYMSMMRRNLTAIRRALGCA